MLILKVSIIYFLRIICEAFTHGIRCDVMDIFIESRTSKAAFKHFYQLQDKAWTCKIELVSEVCVTRFIEYIKVCVWINMGNDMAM